MPNESFIFVLFINWSLLFIVLNQIGINLPKAIDQLVAELWVDLDFAFYLLVTLECTLEAVLVFGDILLIENISISVTNSNGRYR